MNVNVDHRHNLPLLFQIGLILWIVLVTRLWRYYTISYFFEIPGFLVSLIRSTPKFMEGFLDVSTYKSLSLVGGVMSYICARDTVYAVCAGVSATLFLCGTLMLVDVENQRAIEAIEQGPLQWADLVAIYMVSIFVGALGENTEKWRSGHFLWYIPAGTSYALIGGCAEFKDKEASRMWMTVALILTIISSLPVVRANDGDYISVRSISYDQSMALAVVQIGMACFGFLTFMGFLDMGKRIFFEKRRRLAAALCVVGGLFISWVYVASAVVVLSLVQLHF